MAEWFPEGTSWLDPEPVPPTPFPEAWPIGTPESQGMDSRKLNAINKGKMGDCVVIRNGVEVFSTGNVGGLITNWASCSRTWVAVLWGVWLRDNGFEWLERSVWDLPTAAAHEGPDLKLKLLVSYTSQPPVGDSWHYSCGDHWPWQHRLLSGLFGMACDEAFRQHVRPFVGGTTLDARMQGDRTMRVVGSCRDQARLSYMFLNGGMGVLKSEFVARVVAGGHTGDGYPNPVEGYQTHLIRNGHAWELNLPGVPDGFLARDGGGDPNKPNDGGGSHGHIIGLPSRNLIVAGRSSYPCDAFLPQVCASIVT